MRYYIADLHFFHGALNDKMDRRGFASVEEMNEYMIEKWNKKVRKTMTLSLSEICPGEMCRKQMLFCRGLRESCILCAAIMTVLWIIRR